MIEGVIIKQLISHKDNRGFFREIFRIKKNNQNILIKQISHSLVKKNIIKGWHGHKKQYQWNYILSGSALVILFDNRVKSKTYKQTIKIECDQNKKIYGYFFPPGVLHGYKCIQGPMNIIYGTSGFYNLKQEIRKKISYNKLNNFFK